MAIDGTGSLETADGKARIRTGHFGVEDGDMYTGSRGEFVININDSVGTLWHDDQSRLRGCCGPSGTDGRNLVCENGHEVGTIRADCWIPHSVTLDPEAVILEPA